MLTLEQMKKLLDEIKRVQAGMKKSNA